jgi:hypothetical protein
MTGTDRSAGKVGVTVVGVSLLPEVLESLDAMAASDELKRSTFIARLVEAERRRRRAKGEPRPEVLVDGVRYVPARPRPRRQPAKA